jgi:catechol 2,3-dioxygenase-like lactoylglutathione lyase family enzyme
MGYRELERGDGWVSFGDGGAYVTLVQADRRFADRGFHRKAVGVNHLAFLASGRAEVDELHDWLLARGVPVLYGGPRDMGGEDDPNYAVFFEDPDRLKLEYVHRPGRR